MAVGSSLQKACTMWLGMFSERDFTNNPAFTNLCFISLKTWVVTVWKDSHSGGLGFFTYRMCVVICPEESQVKTKFKSVTAKRYHLKANHTHLICTSSLHFSRRDGNPRPCSNYLSPPAPCLGAHSCHCLSFLETPAQLSSAKQDEVVCLGHRTKSNQEDISKSCIFRLLKAAIKSNS